LGLSGEDKARLNGNSAKREGAKKMHLLGPERRVVLAFWKGKNLKIHVKFHFHDTSRIPVSRAHERDLVCVLCFSKMPCPTNIPPLPFQSVSCSEQRRGKGKRKEKKEKKKLGIWRNFEVHLAESGFCDVQISFSTHLEIVENS